MTVNKDHRITSNAFLINNQITFDSIQHTIGALRMTDFEKLSLHVLIEKDEIHSMVVNNVL